VRTEWSRGETSGLHTTISDARSSSQVPSLRLTALFPAPRLRVLSGYVRMTSVGLSRSSGRIREQRGQGRLKSARRHPRHTRHGGRFHI